MQGILAVDKPLGSSSHAVVKRVKRCCQCKKAGHGGALDVMATGLLPVFIGEATKFSQWALNADKTYRVGAQLGCRTTTGDAEGDVLQDRSERLSQLDTSLIQQTIESFLGSSQQIPSMYSALKHKGQPLYRLARQGIEVERQARTIHINDLKIVNLSNEGFTINVSCSKGTYIRNLVDDIGELLGCGAHVTELRRVAVGGLTIDSATSLDSLEYSRDVREQSVKSVDTFLQDFFELTLTADEVKRLQFGQIVIVNHQQLPELESLLRVYQEGDGRRFMGLAQVCDSHTIKAKRLLAH